MFDAATALVSKRVVAWMCVDVRMDG